MYYLSLCCIIKDERNLEEFIMYYTLLGVQHFYIYDNESSYPINDRLNSFFYKHYCTIIDYPGKCQQINAYNHCLDNYGKNTEWLIVVDGDEYILPKIDNTIVDFLKQREYAHAIGINWVFFGTSFNDTKQDGYLVDKYRYCDSNQDRHIKVIVRPKYIKGIGNPHFADMIDPNLFFDAKWNVITGYAFNYNYTIDIIQINHYTFKSLEENNEKHYRGNADSLNRRNCSDQSLHTNFNNIIDNTLPDKYLTRLMRTHSLTAVNLAIYKALNRDVPDSAEESEISNHIIQYGIQQNRPLHIWEKFPEFSREKYRQENPHLNYLDDVHIEIHYINTHS
jgi:hypothetical protein